MIFSTYELFSLPSYIANISFHNLPNVNRSNKKNCFILRKKKKKRKEVDDIEQKLLFKQTTQMIERFLQIHLLDPNFCSIAWSWQQEALVSTWIEFMSFIQGSTIFSFSRRPVGWGSRIPTASLKRGKTSPCSVLDMIVNNLMARLQSWRFGECRVTLHCYYSQVHLNPEW